MKSCKSITMNILKIPWLIMMALTLGCSTSRIIHSWKDDSALRKKYNKILVLAMNGGTSLTTRQRMEMHLAGDLKDLGYAAASSVMEYGYKAFRDMTEETVIEKIKNSGFDAVITIVLLDKKKERTYVPGRVYSQPYLLYYRHFWNYYTTTYDRVYAPGYYTINTRYFWESNLYDVATKELLYSVQTESFDPASSESLAHEYGKLIVKDMVKRHVLARQEPVAKGVH
jgi:hypothetical protein